MIPALKANAVVVATRLITGALAAYPSSKIPDRRQVEAAATYAGTAVVNLYYVLTKETDRVSRDETKEIADAVEAEIKRIFRRESNDLPSGFPPPS